jgi:AcrR family transcriptional regulator
MREVADASGLGRTTVYRHFPTREALLEALFERVDEESQSMAAEAARRPGPALDALRWLGPRCIELAERFRFLQAHRDLRAQTPAWMQPAPEDPLPRFLADAQGRGELRADLPVAWLMASLRALAVAAVDEVGAGRLDPQQAGSLLGESFAALATPR